MNIIIIKTNRGSPINPWESLHKSLQIMCTCAATSMHNIPLFFLEIVNVNRWAWLDAILVSWCEQNWRQSEYKMPIGMGGGVKRCPPCSPPPLPRGILYSPQFHSHQDTKMAVCQTQRLTSTISWKIGDCEQSIESQIGDTYGWWNECAAGRVQKLAL